MDNNNFTVNVQLIEPKNNLLGFATLTFNDAFVVKNISVMQGENGIFAGMPSKKDPTAESGYRQTAHPITKEFHAELNKAVVAAYEKAKNRSPKLKDEINEFKANEKGATLPSNLAKVTTQEAR